MSKVGDLIDTMAGITHDRTDVMIRARNLRAIRVIPHAARRWGGPQIETVHVVSLLLAVLKAGPQVDTAQAVLDLWHLRGWSSTLSTGQESNVQAVGFADSRFLTFGQVVADLMEIGASNDPAERGALPSLFSRISVLRDYSSAQIAYPGGRIDYFQRDDYIPTLESVVSTATSAGPVTIAALSDLVRTSRIEALRLSVTIPTEEAYRALGLLPPGSPGSPARIPGIDSSWSASAGPEMKKAEGLAGPSASAGQTAIPSQSCPRASRQGSETEGEAQQPIFTVLGARSDASVINDKRKDASYDQYPPYSPRYAIA